MKFSYDVLERYKKMPIQALEIIVDLSWELANALDKPSKEYNRIQDIHTYASIARDSYYRNIGRY